MSPSFGDVLGEQILDQKNIRIFERGIAWFDSYMVWDEIEEIYVGGSEVSVNLFPVGENRTISLVSNTNKSFEIHLTSLVRMGQEKQELFQFVYSTILEKTENILWKKLNSKIQSGNRISFHMFDITKEYLYFPKFFGGYKRISTSLGCSCSMSRGELIIRYQEPGKNIKEKNVGKVSDIPNIHILPKVFKVLSHKGEQ